MTTSQEERLLGEAAKLAIPIEQWGKDHWSTLSYVETVAVDYQGQLSADRMRCNINTHPIQEAMRKHRFSSTQRQWQTSWGTVLKNGTMLPEHDDWDCLSDLYHAGLVLHPSNEVVTLTERGWELARELRTWKAQGGRYSDFVPSPSSRDIPTPTPGYNTRLTIFFSWDKNGRKRAYRWNRSQIRAFPVKLAEAEAWVAQQQVDVLPHHPFHAPDEPDQ